MSSLPATQSTPIRNKLEDLRNHLRNLGGLVIGFSGGIDSAFLLKVAVDELGERAVALTAVSPSLPRFELDEAIRLAQSFGARHELMESDEIHNPAYAANPTNRCYFCKEALLGLANDLKIRLGLPHVAIGTNLDDLGDHRPGLLAAERYGALHPLVDAGFSKADVREAAQLIGIDIWDKPAYACLSSRFPYGVEITAERLQRVEACERLMRDQGFRVFRVRFHGDLVRIELGEAELSWMLEPARREAVAAGCRAAGFRYVSLDLEPYRSGRLNEGVVRQRKR